ncbi:unnamed protein product [Timema podura]|uniref:Uncharacterized protein n=1 Tax=Timema podura TaxID=61482 RepID=A0ABN7PBT6_TIMPD|nr:unnamed protein product [Timema podura]
MVSRYGGRKPESTVHCFMPHCAHPPPQHHQQHPPPPLSQFRIISANTGSNILLGLLRSTSRRVGCLKPCMVICIGVREVEGITPAIH